MLSELGIGIGKMAITMKRFQFRLGDTIQGVVSLRLRRPVEAKALTVGLTATQRTLSYRVYPRNILPNVQTRNDRVFDFHYPLLAEGRIEGGHYPFEIAIPSRAAVESAVASGELSGLLKAVSLLLSAARFPIEWRVVAALRIPWKLNVSAKADITVDRC